MTVDPFENDNRWLEGHVFKDLIKSVLADEYLTSMVVEDYFSYHLTEKETTDWHKTFIKGEADV